MSVLPSQSDSDGVTVRITPSHLFATRPTTTDNACRERTYIPADVARSAPALGGSTAAITVDDAVRFAGKPLEHMGLADIVVRVPCVGNVSTGEALPTKLPFKLKHSDATSIVGARMLQQLTGDLEWSSKKARNGLDNRLACMAAEHIAMLRAGLDDNARGSEGDDALAAAYASLMELKPKLVAQQHQDNTFVDYGFLLGCLFVLSLPCLAVAATWDRRCRRLSKMPTRWTRRRPCLTRCGACNLCCSARPASVCTAGLSTLSGP